MSRKKPRPLDDEDRAILGALVKDARVPFSKLGELIGISAPAAHSRVKHLRKDGRVLGEVTLIDELASEKPFLAMLHIDTKDASEPVELIYLAKFPEVEELISVSGDTRFHMKVRTESSSAFERFLERLWAIDGVVSVKSYVALTTYVSRPSQVGVTREFK